MSQQKSRMKWNPIRRKKESLNSIKRKADVKRKIREQKAATPNKVFNSAQSYGRAMARVQKSLPSTPKKKRAAVVRSLASSFGIAEKKA